MDTSVGKNVSVIISIGSATALVAAITLIGFAFVEISDFHERALEDMEDFKIFANDAWSDMISSGPIGSYPRQTVSAIHSILIGRRVKRSSCGCAQGPNECPPGPTGPAGEPGIPGIHGEPGVDGRTGQLGYEVMMEAMTRECFTCPPGPPGQPGSDGEYGLPGLEGRPGYKGFPGKNGQYGPLGPRGERGSDGKSGPPGYAGQIGRNGRKGQGAPGPVGHDGRPGPAGNPGSDGELGPDGIPGPQGDRGYEGRSGENGPTGEPGSEGGLGIPGPDAAYCPCPKRTKEMAVMVNPGAYGGYEHTEDDSTTHSSQQPYSVETVHTGTSNVYEAFSSAPLPSDSYTPALSPQSTTPALKPNPPITEFHGGDASSNLQPQNAPAYHEAPIGY